MCSESRSRAFRRRASSRSLSRRHRGRKVWENGRSPRNAAGFVVFWWRRWSTRSRTVTLGPQMYYMFYGALVIDCVIQPAAHDREGTPAEPFTPLQGRQKACCPLAPFLLPPPNRAYGFYRTRLASASLHLPSCPDDGKYRFDSIAIRMSLWLSV